MKRHGNSYSTEQFIEKALEKHGNKYDYSTVNYVSSQRKVEIICPHHGKFSQLPAAHLHGNGCPGCQRDVASQRNRMSTEEFLTRVKEVHGNTYDYSKVVYVNARMKIDIVCPTHGLFSQLAGEHICGAKCPLCMHQQRANKKRKTPEQFVSDAKAVHGDKYDYSHVVYKNTSTKVEILCPTHGVFLMTPKDHLTGKQGCKKCINKKQYSNIAIRWLESIEREEGIHIHHMGNSQSEYVLPGTKIKVDGFCAETNTVYEFYGDKFHGNPAMYNSGDTCHPFNERITASELYDSTRTKETTITSLGYNLVTIWESDYRRGTLITRSMI